MTDRALQPLCSVCGRPVPGADGSRPVRCPACFESYLRSVDGEFLEHHAQFGARSHQVVAETCLRALVLANAADRKLLAMTIYEQFVAAASDLIALMTALRSRALAPISRTFLDFRLDPDSSRRFFAEIASQSGMEMLGLLGLPGPEQAGAGLPRKIERDVRRSLREVLEDLRRLNELRELGERALALASDHFRAGAAVTDRTEWLAGREISPGQVASVALDPVRGRLDIAALRVDEERLAQVVDAIDVMSRLARNLSYAFVTVQDRDAFIEGFRNAPRVRAG